MQQEIGAEASYTAPLRCISPREVYQSMEAGEVSSAELCYSNSVKHPKTHATWAADCLLIVHLPLGRS